MRYFLRKNNILRGFGSYEEVLSAGKKFYSDNLFISIITEPSEEPSDIKTGFLVSKKKSKKHSGATD